MTHDIVFTVALAVLASSIDSLAVAAMADSISLDASLFGCVGLAAAPRVDLARSNHACPVTDGSGDWPVDMVACQIGVSLVEMEGIR